MRELSGIGLKGEADFFRTHNNRILNKNKRIKSIKLKGFHIVFILSIFVVTGFVAFKIGKFLLTWEKLNIQSYNLVNGPKFQSKKLNEILKKYNGNILTLNLDDLRKELLTLREIKEVSLSRNLPSSIEINFKLRKPIFQVVIKKKYNIIDDEGVILYESKTKNENFIEIRDIKIDDLSKIVPYLSELSRIRNNIDYIGLQKPYGVKLKLKHNKEIFYPGESDFARKINLYLEIREKPIIKMEKVKCVDLRFKDRFYLEYEEEVDD
jgi:cell division septal protein FtsQ